LNNITAEVCERQDANRTREAGHLDQIQGVVAITFKSFPNGAVGFIVWLYVLCVLPFFGDVLPESIHHVERRRC
jgi:hypothetical protein